MSLKNLLEEKLKARLGNGADVKIDLEGSPCGYKAKLVVVSDSFEGLSRLQRHRLVHDSLQSEIETDLHAISVTTLTVRESDNKSRFLVSKRYKIYPRFKRSTACLNDSCMEPSIARRTIRAD